MLPSPRPVTPAVGPEPVRVGPELRLVPGKGRVAVLLNANAKRVNGSVRKQLEAVVPEKDLFFSTSIAEGEAMARTIVERRYPLVMCGGGDGTIANTMNFLLRASEALGNGIHRHPLPDIGILKLGTGNGLAGATSSGKPIEDVCRALAGEAPRARPLHLVEDARSGFVHPFGSLGYDAQVLNDYLAVNSSVTSGVGKALAKSLPGYFYALGTRTIPYEMKGIRPHVRVRSTGRASMIDPETREEVPIQLGATLFEGMARSVGWGTTPYYGFKMKVYPYADRRRDRFHLRISTAPISWLLTHLPSLWNGSVKTPYITDFLVEGVSIETSVPMPYQNAGDALGTRDRVELRLSPRTFRVLDASA